MLIEKILRRKILKDIINFVFGSISFKTFSVILTIILARILGVKGYGIYTILISLAFLTATFSDLGTQIALVRFLASNKEDIEKSRTLFLFLLKILIISNFILIIFSIFSKKILAKIFLKDESLENLIILSFLLTVFSNIYRFLNNVFVAYKRFNLVRNFMTLEGLLKIVLLPIFSIFYKEKGAILGFILVYILLVLLVLKVLVRDHKYLLNFREKNKKINKREILKYLLFLNTSTISRGVYGWVDSLILGIFLNVESVSYYRIGCALVNALLSFCSFQGIFSPRFAEWNIKKIVENLPKVLLLNIISTIPMIIFLVLFGKVLILIIYGVEYLNSYYIALLLTPIMILNSVSYFTVIFDMKGFPQYSTACISIMNFLNIVLDIMLVPKMLIKGAIAATVISWIVSLILALLIFVKKMSSLKD